MLNGYRNDAFGIGSQIGLNDFFVGDGVTTDFDVTNKTGLATASVIQVGNNQRVKRNQGFTVISNTISFSTAPALGDIITVPGTLRFIFKAYGQAVIEGGDPNPNISETAIWFADIDETGFEQYVASVGQAGIKVSINDHDASNGALPSWLQFAPALGDGSAGAYGAAGDPIYLDDLVAADTAQSGLTALGTSLPVADGSQFTIGRYVCIDFGVIGFQDEVRIVDIIGNILVTTPFTYNHTVGAAVYENAFKVWAKLTLPTSFTEIRNYYETCVEMLVDQISRS